MSPLICNWSKIIAKIRQDCRQLQHTKYQNCVMRVLDKVDTIALKLQTLNKYVSFLRPIPVVALSKAWDCVPLLAGFMVSNPAGRHRYLL